MNEEVKFTPVEKLLPFPPARAELLALFDDPSLSWWKESLKCLRPPRSKAEERAMKKQFEAMKRSTRERCGLCGRVWPKKMQRAFR
jgi:hypothetical protein